MATRSAKSTDRARETFLAELRATGNISHSARAAGMNRQTFYNWRDADPDFAAAWEDAEEEAIDELEKVARDRAIDSSDRMLEILLKAHRPHKYVERRLLGSDPANPMPTPVTLDPTALSEAALKEVVEAKRRQEAGE
jgi:AcrR family transcriptional regulator